MIERFLTWAEDGGRFWLVVVGAAFVKVLLSESLTVRQAFATFAVAIFSAWVGTDPIMNFSGIGDGYKEIVAVTLGLTGEQLMRAVILISKDPEWIKSIIARRMGGGK